MLPPPPKSYSLSFKPLKYLLRDLSHHFLLLWLGFLAAGFVRLLVWITGAGEKVIPGNSGELGDLTVLLKHQKTKQTWYSARRAPPFSCLLLLLRLWVWELSDFLPVASRKKLASKIVAFPPAPDFSSSQDSRS